MSPFKLSFLIGCFYSGGLLARHVIHHEVKMAKVARAEAILQAKSGSHVSGKIFFVAEGGTIEVKGFVHGLEPDTTHGFHIHEKGDCSALDASSAGGHFNPEHTEHGNPSDSHSHVGDLGNIISDAKGDAVFQLSNQHKLAFTGSHNILGKSVIIHAGMDDLVSDPAGNSGKKIACGVIHLIHHKGVAPKMKKR